MDFIIKKNEKVNIYLGKNESEAVKIAAGNLVKDLKKTLEAEAEIVCPGEAGGYTEAGKAHSIFIQTTGNSGEGLSLCVENGNLHVMGRSRRGTVYGIYTLSEMLGVSPWYYFADVPVKRSEVFMLPEDYAFSDEPTIPYRGIFINDEEELDKWARLHMQEPTIGVNTYEKIFELILRLKGNYIWPAMHVNSFNLNKENGDLANRMGIVVGTSHCDMLMRSNYREWEPWTRRKGYTDAKYDYSFGGKNREILKEYWRESAEQNKDFEVSYTLGMRGIHDSGFVTEGLTADSEEELKDKKVKLLEQVINDQKDILKEVTGTEPFTTFVPYKEVMTLYDRGLKVPEDVTLIWTNDNYGYVRRYPSPEEQKRPGGHGIYYHNSYWAPTMRHYLFISSYPIAQTKYEMDKAYENGIRKLWVCNMGALKPLEQEMEFFLRLGWDYGKKNAKVNDPEDYLADWIDRNFSGGIGRKTAKLLNRYARVSNTRKVEMMEEDVFTQDVLHNEAAIRLNTLKELFDEGNTLAKSLPADERDAFFELVLMKIHAAYYTAAMYYFADRSDLCNKKGRFAAGRRYAELSKGFEDLRRDMLTYYNTILKDGKWDGILTPEDFPPPRAAMHPASVLPLTEDPGEPDHQDGPKGRAEALAATEGKTENCRVIKDLGRGCIDLLEISEGGSAEYDFTSDGSEVILQIHRYPSLNSVGEISADIYLDGGKLTRIVSESNDEWRGNWAENVLDNVDRLSVSLGTPAPGRHTVRIAGGSRYFAFYKVVFYYGSLLKDNLGALCPDTYDYASEDLPGEEYLSEAKNCGYAGCRTEFVIPLGSFVDGRNVSDATDSKDYVRDTSEKELFMPDGRLNCADYSLMGLGRKASLDGNEVITPYAEDSGNIVIDAFGAYNGTDYAFKTGDWEYSTGVTYDRTNLALYFRGRGMHWNEEDAPTLNYRIDATGGEYLVYVLMKYDSSEEARVSLSLDEENLPTAWRNDKPWRYEGEKAFRYVPLAKTDISKGEHLLSLKIFASGIRIERIILRRIANHEKKQ